MCKIRLFVLGLVFLAAIVILLLFASCPKDVQDTHPATIEWPSSLAGYEWAELSDLKMELTNPGVASIGDMIYILDLAGVYHFNTATLEVEKHPSILPRRYTTAVAFGSNVYSFCGVDKHNTGDPTTAKATLVYNPDTYEWESRRPLPEWTFAVAVALEQKILIFGFDPSFESDLVLGPIKGYTLTWLYDPEKRTWHHKSKSWAKRFREHFGVGVINGKLYVVGGTPGCQDATNVVEVYDFETNTYTPVASMNTPQNYPGVGVLNGKLVVVGGWDGKKALSSAEIYSPEEDKWESLPNMREARTAPGVEVVGDKLYVFGGHMLKPQNSTQERFYKTVEVLQPSHPALQASGSCQRINAMDP